jgi:CubicO group peptidase (beta-lactamase class C family)
MRCSRRYVISSRARTFARRTNIANLGYVAAGMVAERISGQTWEDFTRERIMKPLGMVHTGFSDEDLERVPDSARPYIVHDQEKSGEFVRRRAASMSPHLTWHDTCGCTSTTARSTSRRSFRRRG